MRLRTHDMTVIIQVVFRTCPKVPAWIGPTKVTSLAHTRNIAYQQNTYSVFKKPCHLLFQKKKNLGDPANSEHTCYATSHFFTALLWSMAEIIAIDPPPAHQNGSSGPLVADPELEPTFELLITLIHPLKCICTPNKKMKSLKQEPENKGPFNISINIGWDDFLGVIAEKLSVLCTSLAVTSFEWHWLKPASSPWLHIRDESGFTLMLKKVKMKNELYVIIHMPVPTQRKVAPGNVWDSANELDFNLGESTVTKKVSIHLIVGILSTQFLSGKAG